MPAAPSEVDAQRSGCAFHEAVATSTAPETLAQLRINSNDCTSRRAARRAAARREPQNQASCDRLGDKMIAKPRADFRESSDEMRKISTAR